MLGLTSPEQKWLWSAYGKHPVARDFLRIGQPTPIGTGLSEWVDKGFNGLAGVQGSGRLPRFWRFWARGGGKNELVCGVLRDSCDSVGRIYPFLVLGSGGLHCWDVQWDLLPYGCDMSWRRIEYLCTKNYADVGGIEREVLNLRQPLAEWEDYRAARKAGTAGCRDGKSLAPDLPTGAKGETGGHLTVPLDRQAPDSLLAVGLLTETIRERHRDAPNIAFIGGTSEAACLSIYWRPLQSRDFATLWG